MSVRYRNDRTGDVVELPAVDARLERLDNWKRDDSTPAAAQEPTGPAPAEDAPPAAKAKPRRKPTKARSAAKTAAPTAQTETPAAPASEAGPAES